jgi:AraC-like DNA-binding protein
VSPSASFSAAPSPVNGFLTESRTRSASSSASCRDATARIDRTVSVGVELTRRERLHHLDEEDGIEPVVEGRGHRAHRGSVEPARVSIAARARVVRSPLMDRDSATIVASWTRRVVDVAQREGLNAAPFLSSAEVDRALLDDPTARVPFASHAALAHSLAARLDDPGLGLAVGASAGAADFGVVGLLAESCATLGDALRCVQRFNVLANEASRMELRIEGRNAIVIDGHFTDGAPVPALLAEATLAFYANVIRAVTGIREPLAELWLAHPTHRGWTRRRREHFSTSLHFDRAWNAVVLPAALLDAKLVSARPELGPHLRALADRLERDLGALDDVSVRVAAQVRRDLSRGPAPLARTARALGTSARSLQRRLEERGLSYAAVVDGVRRREVEALLADPSFTLCAIAERAGYADTRALRRACRRWFGQSASSRRRAAR